MLSLLQQLMMFWKQDYDSKRNFRIVAQSLQNQLKKNRRIVIQKKSRRQREKLSLVESGTQSAIR